MQSYQDEAEEFLAKLFKDFNELQKDYNKLSLRPNIMWIEKWLIILRLKRF